MSGFFENLLQDAAGAFFGSEYLRDYTHASKTFRTNSYQNAPKLKFLFHTYFDINPAAVIDISTGANFGLAVKTVRLPSFTFDTHTMNQYNRKRIVQTKIKYDNAGITFHDDGGNMIRKLWKAYYNYYYKDGKKPQVIFGGARGGAGEDFDGGRLANAAAQAAYNTRTTYKDSITGDVDWGYIGESSATTGPGLGKVPFFKNITVFGLNQHNWVAYTLVNPIITKFGHDTYNYSEATGTMEMSMDIDYETVVYDEGGLDGRTPADIVTGFGDNATYDTRLSPIAKPGSNATILGQGGLVDAAGGFVDNLANGNVLGAVQKAGTAYNTFKNKNLVTIAKTEALTGLQNAVTNTPNTNRNTPFNIPGPFGASPGPAGTAGASMPGVIQTAKQIGNKVAGKQVF